MNPIPRLVLASALAFAWSNTAGADAPGSNLANMVEGSEPADDHGTVLGPAAQSVSASNLPAGTLRSGSEREKLVVGANVRVNAEQAAFPNGLLGRSETTIAATDDGQNIVVGFNDAQGFCGPPFGRACTPQNPSGLSGFAFSIDGGKSFVDGNAPPALGTTVFTRGDPWMASQEDTIFYANLAVDAFTGEDLGVSIHRGRFFRSGFSWFDVRVFNAPNAPNDFYDKEAIAMSKDGERGVVTMTNFVRRCGVAAAGFGQIEVWRTDDGGDTWHGPAVAGSDLTFNVDPTDPNCGSAGTLQQSSAPAVERNGRVFVAWQRGPDLGTSPAATSAQIVVGRSLNGGTSFDSPAVVATINTMRNNPPVGYNRDRINDHPRIAVAPNGRVFVAFTSAVAPVLPGAITPCPPPAGTLCRPQSLTSSQVFVSFSDDRGVTWSAPAAVAPAPPPTGLKRWWPVVSVSKKSVDVVYYESRETSPSPTSAQCDIGLGGPLRRRGPAHSLVNTFVARSRDGGRSFGAPVLVSTATSDWCTALANVRPNFGDYIAAIGGDDGSILATWADSRNGPVDTFFAPVSSGD